MRRSTIRLKLAACCLVLGGTALAQPKPLATPTERLDHLLAQWRGQPVARVREVFGREDAVEMRGTNPVLVYEKRVRVRPTLGGIAIHPNGGARCVLRFLISDTEEVLRVARQGGGAECWNAWRENTP